jgi:hypothetical protein
MRASLFIYTICAFAHGAPAGEDRVASLAARWGGTADVLKLTALVAPNGYVLLAAPDMAAKVLTRVDKPTVVMVKVEMKLRSETFYVSDWGYLRIHEGKTPNWIYLLPGPKKAPSAGNPTVYWEDLYSQMRSDYTMRNCDAAFHFFAAKLQGGDESLLQFLERKVYNETDPQARACVAALLCLCKAFRHDTTFAKHLVWLLQDYQQNRHKAAYSPYQAQSAKDKNRIYDNHWDFIGDPALLNHIWIRFLVRNAPKYENILAAAVFDPSNDLMVKWVAIHALARHKLLESYYGRFDAKFFRTMFDNLRDDSRKWNLLWATRVLVILEPVARPQILQRLREPKLDDQEKDVLTMFGSGILKSRNLQRFQVRYGDLRSNIYNPEWISVDQFDFNYELEMFR